MRLSIIVLACLSVTVPGCGSTEVEQLSAPSSSTRCDVTASGAPGPFPATGGTGTVQVSANRDCTWRVQSDAQWLVPGVPPIRGRESIAAAWKNVLGSGGNRVRVDVHEVTENGDWAFEIGEFTATGPNGQTINSGKYMVIWRRDGSGNWRAYRDIFHWDIPPEGIAA